MTPAAVDLPWAIRTRLADALHSAERAVTVASEKQHLSEMEVQQSLARVDTFRIELAALTR
jgi:hypothetical protein